MSAPSGAELHSWKEIAAYLGVSIKTAQLWERNRALPIHRIPGARGRVWTTSAELDAWRRVTPEASTAVEAGAAAFWNWRKVALIALIPAVVFVAYASWALRPQPRIPYRATVLETEIVVSDESGVELWRRGIGRRLHARQYAEDPPGQLNWIGDLDGDGSKEVLLAFVPQSVGSSSLICYEASGKQRWEFVPGRAVSAEDGARYGNHFQIASFKVLQTPFAPARIVVAANQVPDFVSQLALLSGDGGKLRDIWHSGHLHRIAEHQLNGKRVLLVGGINNERREAELLVLDPDRMAGMIPETNPMYRLVGSPVVGVERRILFPGTCIGRRVGTMGEISVIDVHNDGVIVGVVEPLPSSAKPGMHYHFGLDLSFQSARTNSVFDAEHPRLHAEGRLDHAFSKRELEVLRPVVR